MSSNPERLRNRAARAMRLYFERKGSMRLMLSLVILVTGLAGFLISAGLLKLGMTDMWSRYPLAVIGAYGIFLGLIRVWVEVQRRQFNADDPEIQRALDDAGEDPHRPSEIDIEGRESRWTDWLNVSPDLDEGCLPALLFGAVIALVVVLVSALGAAPVLIAEVFVDVALTTLLYRRLNLAAKEHWLGTAISKTWAHVLLAALAVAVIGGCLDLMAPASNTVGQALREIF